MSETLPPPFEEAARILEILPVIDEEGNEMDDVYFIIGEEDRGRDVTATLSFLEPDPTKFANNVEYFLKDAIEIRGALDNQEVRIIAPNPIDTGTDKAEVIHLIRFSNNLTLKDVKTSFRAIYGERLPQQLIILLERLVDSGYFRGQKVKCTPHNEIKNTPDHKVVEEMDYLTRRFEAGEL